MIRALLVCFFVMQTGQGFLQDEGSQNSITFEIKNAGFPVHGSLSGIKTKIIFDPKIPSKGSIEASTDPATVQAGNSIREKHLKRRDYFDVQNYPLVNMKSISIKGLGKGKFSGSFALTIKSTKRVIQIPFELAKVKGRSELSSNFTINRIDFGVGEKSLLLSDSVLVHVELVY